MTPRMRWWQALFALVTAIALWVLVARDRQLTERVEHLEHELRSPAHDESKWQADV